MARILCLDLGTRHTGAAVTDPTRTIVQGLPTIEHRDEDRLITQVAGLLREWQPAILVVGLPLSPDGAANPRSEAVTRFANRLRNRFKLPIEFQDERHSSNRAAEILHGLQTPATHETRATGMRARPVSRGRSRTRKLAADRIAAVLILEDWLAERRA